MVDRGLGPGVSVCRVLGAAWFPPLGEERMASPVRLETVTTLDLCDEG